MFTRPHRIALILTTAGVAAGTAAGIAAAAGGSTPSTGAPIQYSGASSNGLPTAASWDGAVSTAAKNMQGTAIAAVQKSAAPSALGKSQSTTWLSITVNGPQTLADGAEVPLKWEAALTQGAVADLMRGSSTTTQQVVGGSSINVVHPDGTSTALDPVSAGDVAAGQVFALASSASDSDIRARISQTLHQFGLSAVQIDVIHPLSTAVSIVASLPNDATMGWKLSDVIHGIVGTPAQFEGFNLEIVDPSGKPLLRQAAAYRVGETMLWFAPGQDARFGISYGHLTTLDPPSQSPQPANIP